MPHSADHPDARHARSAEKFVAVAAFHAGCQCGMIVATGSAVGQCGHMLQWPCGHVWHHDLLGLSIEDQCQATYMQHLSGHQFRFANRLAVDEGSVGGSEIGDQDHQWVHGNFAVLLGNGGMVQAEGRMSAATDPVFSGGQLVNR